MSLQFEIINKELFILHKQKTFLSFLDKNTRTIVDSLAFYYCYGEELLKENLINEYVKNPTLPMVWLSSYDHFLIPQIKYKNPKQSLFIDLCESKKTELIFEDSIEKMNKNNIIENCKENGISIITTSTDISRYDNEITNKYTSLFLNYLKGLEDISNTISKTIFVIKFEYDTLPAEELSVIHNMIKNIKKAGHIVIFVFHFYGDPTDLELNLFDEGIYSNYIISTIGFNNEYLSKISTKKIFKNLPKQLKDFLTDPQFNIKCKNYYHSSHKVSVVYDWGKMKII